MTVDQYTIKIAKDDKGREYFTHLKCGRRSYNPNDIRYKYCAVCHTFPDDERKKLLLRQNISHAEKNAIRKGF